MKYDKFGVAVAEVDELCDLLYTNPQTDIKQIFVNDPTQFNDAVDQLYADFDKLTQYNSSDIDINEFDQQMQQNWDMPDEYKELDIAHWLIEKCSTDQEVERVGKELLMYQERGMFDLLKQIKYIIDTWRKNNIVWGVGRGSSVASYVLYLLGAHKINSIQYNLDIHEFLR
jgi:DNA polymerase III alpha subunit